MYNRLKEILLDKNHPSSRYFIFPRKSGTSTLLCLLTKDIAQNNNSIVLVVASEMMKNIRNAELQWNNVINIKTIHDNLSGYSYYIFDNCFIEYSLRKDCSILNNNWIAVDTK